MNLLIVDPFGVFILAFPVIFFLVFVYAVVYIIRSARNGSRLREIAPLLGLQFYQGSELPEECQKMVLRLEAMTVQQRVFFCMKGHFNGVPVYIFATRHGNGRNSSHQTYIMGGFERPLEHKVFISKDGFLLSMVGKLFGLHEIKVGDEVLDKKYFMLGENEGEVSEFVHKPMVQQGLDKLFKKFRSFVNESGAVMVRGGQLVGDDENDIKGYLSEVTDIVREMGR